MGLAPKEQRALAGIEDALRRSDPRLGTMLATFTVTLGWGRIRWWLGSCLRQRSRMKTFAPVALAAVVVVLVILGAILLGHPRPLLCSSRNGDVGASVLTSDCQRGGGPSQDAVSGGTPVPPPGK